MDLREEQMSLKMELEPRSASLMPTMVVTMVAREESVLEDSDWVTSKFSVGVFFSSVCLASRKQLFDNAE